MMTMLPLLALAALAAVGLPANAAARPGAGDTEIVVSPRGDDAANGTAQAPVATLQRAQVLAREALTGGQAVRVTLLGGVYRLDQTLVFTAADSGTQRAPVLWQAAPGEKATISGGALLTLRWEPYRDGIFKASVPADFVSDQLFVNGVRQHMARYPNFDPGQRIMNGYAADCISPERAARWADPAGGYIHAMHSHLWGDYHYRITGKNADGNLRYEGGWQNNRQMGMHKEYRYVENLFEELDAPGEWYHDAKSHTLYYYPAEGVDLGSAVIESVRLRHLVELRGSEKRPVANLTLRGITFTHAARTFMDNREPLVRSDWTTYRGGALLFDGAEGCRIEQCTIDQVGGNAIFFSNYNRHCAVQSCRISDAGANGVAFVGDPSAARSPLFEYNQRQSYDAMDKERGPRSSNYPADCLVEDCLIYRTGRVEKQTAPVQIELSARIAVRHCSIYEVPRAGINIGDGCWGGHVIEFCDVFDTVRETGDHGSFNSWGRDRYWLPGIKEVDALVAAHPELPTLDCIEPITIRNNRWRCDHGWDIDLDDGSSYYRIYNNLCLHGGIKNREGYGRVVENNILVNNTFHPHVWYANSGDVFRRNILFGEYQPVNLERPWGKEVDRNLLHRPRAGVGRASRLHEQSGRDEHSLVGDALFVDPARGDYRVKEGSPALGLGFVNFPMDQFGVVSPALRKLARTPLVAVATAAAESHDQQVMQWLGADVKSVTTPGEVSATGLGRAEGVLLVRVPADSAAAKAGLRDNDVILKLNATPVANWEDLSAAWQATGTGPVQLAVWREQKMSTIELGAAPRSAAPSRQTLSLDRGWRFHLGDIPHTSFKANNDEAEGGGKGAAAWGAAAPGYDDRGWRELNLPHDWVVEQPFDATANRSQGYRQRGIAWYRRQFKLEPSDRGKHLELQFDGVATHCTVWFNGAPVHRNWNGYTSFSIDITPMAHYGDAANTIAVRVDANDMEGWWYEGGGIYRHTWLVQRSPVHIVTDGVYANPVKGADGEWVIPLEVTLENSGRASANAIVHVQVADPQGNTVATAETPATVESWQRGVAKLSIAVAAPQLWSVEQPNLYTVTTRVTSDDKADEVTTQCGFRTIRFDAKQGFFLNDRPLVIQGVCNHQDHAGVGVAVPDALLEFRLRKLKEMGANAIRSAHNPPSKELLDLCDRLGMLVMDENRHFNASAEYLAQLEWLVRRDRNHPSVILWSLFNEENALQGSEQGREMTRRMVAAVKHLDATRPVTAAMNGGQLDGDRANANSAAQELDVVGINYQVDKYDKIRAAYPDKPIISSEDTSQVMTRGAYVTDWGKLILAAYDDKYPGWASSNRSAWEAIARQPSFAGGFLWTGFDYRGEPSPFGWPAVSSYFGCLDLCGFPKTAFYIRQALWVHDRPVLMLVPHWNWPGKEGQPVRVMAITNADTVGLFLNGRPLEEKPVGKFDMVQWQVPYEPGRLEAVAKKDGREIVRCSVETTGEPTQIQLTPDRTAINADGEDGAVFTVSALDAQGRVVPVAQNRINFTIAGAGRIIGVGNGDPTSHEPDIFLPPDPRLVVVNDWRWKLGDFSADRSEAASEFDDSSWASAKRGEMPLKANERAIFRARVKLTPDDLDAPSIQIHLGTMDDHGWIYVNGQVVGESHDWQARPVIEIRKHLRAGDNVIAVRVKNDSGPGGLDPAANLFLSKAAPTAWSRSLFNGLAQVIVQSTREAGVVTLTASSEGLAPAAVSVQTKPWVPRPAVP